MDITLETAQRILQSQPFSGHMGARVTHFSPDGVELRLPIDSKLHNQHGFVHGGALSYMADNALTFAGSIALGTAIVTSEFKINYVRPANGSELVAKAKVLHGGTRQAVCQCEILSVADGNERLCAIAQGTIASLSSARNA